jgi:RNA polymerase sigma-70 factor (ECF subfamily)
MHRDRLVRVLARTAIGSGDVDDVVQEAFWILARRLAAVPERSERAFLLSTALRLASDRRRSIWNRIMSQELFDDSTGEDDSERLVESRQERRRLDVALANLPDEERSTFLLIELEALSRHEAAHVLGVPPGTVASRLARARLRVKTMMQAASSTAELLGPPETNSGITVGNQHFCTNAWGFEKTTGRFEQRLIRRQRGGAAQHGWYWHWPGHDRSVFAYPEVLIGWKPWMGGKPTDTRLPIRIRDARRLTVEYAVEMRTTGSCNLALSTWLRKAPGWSLAADLEGITTEVMIWPDYTPGATPPGRLVYTFTLDGDDYEIWRAVGHGKRYLRNDRGWTVLTLRGVGCRTSGTLGFGELLHELARREFVDLDEYVTCIELGNEVMGGAGTTFVERFQLDL